MPAEREARRGMALRYAAPRASAGAPVRTEQFQAMQILGELKKGASMKVTRKRKKEEYEARLVEAYESIPHHGRDLYPSFRSAIFL